MVRVRFAPSPTGLLHVGNARIALLNLLFARKEGGAFILRLDDTDNERSEARYESAIRRDLAWLGLHWNEEYRQSDRLARYAAAAERLKASGRLYPCFETPEELDRWRKSRQRRRLPPIYTTETRDSDANTAGEKAGRPAHWRFALDRAAGRRIVWRDLVRGPAEFDAGNLSDPILVRGDGRPLYALSSVVDDIELRISHIVRGEDHVANTALQIQLFAALGAAPQDFAFAHLPLLVAVEGGALSKREGALSLASMREDGIEPMAIDALLAVLGTGDPVEPTGGLDDLAVRFDWARFGRATAQFDPAALAVANARLLHETPFAAVKDRLAQAGLGDADEAFWNVVRPNIGRFSDVADWWRIVSGPVAPAVEDARYLAEALDHLPPQPWSENTWAVWTGALARRTGRKGRALYHPLRLALTGRERGPELKNLLPLIGRERAAARLAGRTA